MKTEDVLAAMKQGPFKVVPHTKTAGANGLENCHVWTHGGKEQGFLWVAKYRGGYKFALDHDSGTTDGDFFYASDFEPYIEPFKVGDIVRIRDTLVAGQKYDGGCLFTTGMDKFKGKTAKITKKNNYVPNHFFLDIDKEYWDWTPSMLEHVEVNESPVLPAKQPTHSPSIRIKSVHVGRVTVVTLADGRKGAATCGRKDTFDPVKGVALAYSRALGMKCEKEEV